MTPSAKKYYEGGYRAVIDGIPVRLAFKPSAHALAVMRCESDTKFLRELETARFAETTYGPVPDGWYCSRAVRAKDSDTYFIIVGGVRQPDVFKNWRAASDAFAKAKGGAK